MSLELDELRRYAERLLTPDQLARLAAYNVPLTGPNGLRKHLAAHSIEAFIKLYLGRDFYLPLPDFHCEQLAQMEDVRQRAMQKRSGRKLALAIPRGHSKTTLWAKALPLHGLLFGWSPLTVLLGNNQTAAERLVKNIKDELDSNEAILEDFGAVNSPIWGTGRLETTSGCVVVAFGRGSGAIRGVGTKVRPTLVVADDLDDDQSVRSQSETAAAIDWFDQSVLSIGDQVGFTTSFVVIGTVISPHSLFQHILDAPDFEATLRAGVLSFATNEPLWAEWTARILDLAAHDAMPRSPDEDEFYQTHKAELLEGAEVLWPRQDAYWHLMVFKLARGDKAFASEIMNQPGQAGTSGLGPLPTLPRAALPPRYELERLAALDPTTSGAKTADRPGWVEVLFHAASQTLYVDYVHCERAPYSDTLDTLVQRIDSLPPLDGLWMETNAAGTILRDLFQQALKDAGRDEVVLGYNSKTAKNDRIAFLGVLAKRGQLFAVEDVDEELSREWNDFPFARNDDVLDALAAIALQLKERGRLERFAVSELENYWNGQ